jgi:hypothetical protein
LLKAEILHVGSELTADIFCADTWEMFQSLDNHTNIPVTWSSKSVISHDLATANGVISQKNDVGSPLTSKQTDNHKKRHSQSSSKSDEKSNSTDQTSSPSKGGNGDNPKVVSSKSDVKMNVASSRTSLISSNTSLSLLCGGDFKSLAVKRVENPDSHLGEAVCNCDKAQDSGAASGDTTVGSCSSPKVECATDNNKSRLPSPHADSTLNNNNTGFSMKAANTLTSLPGSKTSDNKGNGVRKITSFSIRDIVTGDKTESSSGDASPPAIVSSGLTYRGSSPPMLISSVSSGSPNLPTKTSLIQPVASKSGDVGECCVVSNENLDSVNNNSVKSSKDENLRVKGATKDGRPNVSGSTGNSVVNVANVQCAISDNPVGGSTSSVEKKMQIRKPAKKRFSRGCESLNFDNKDLSHEVESVKTDVISHKSNSPETVDVLSVDPAPQVSSRLSELVAASTSNSSVDCPAGCRPPKSNLISESPRSCPRSPTKRKTSESSGHDSDISQAKKVKKKLFESDSASVRELVRAASNSPGSDSAAEPVSSSQGNNDTGNNKPRLESLGTIIYWHDYFNEEFFKESLEMEDCLHPKPDSSSYSREPAVNPENRQNSEVNRPQTLTVSVGDTVSVSSTCNPVVTAHSSAFDPQTLNASNPVLRSAVTAPLNLSLKDREERDVTSSHSNSVLAKSPDQDNRNPTQRLATRGQGNKIPEDKPVDVSSRSKVSYSLREIYKRTFGIYPPMSHRSEDDCITLMQLVQTVAPKAAIWLDINSCPFRQVEPQYTRKGQ